MALIVPSGELSQIDIQSPDDLISLLAYDKHQMLEEIIVEGLFRKYFRYLEASGIAILNIDLIKAKHNGRQPVWLLWDYGRTNAIVSRIESGLLRSLRTNVLQCRYSEPDRDFYFNQGFRDCAPNESIRSYMMRKRKLPHPLQSPQLAAEVRDTNRRRQAFWGGIQGLFGDRLFDEIVIHRLFKSFVVQPFFRYLWDVDNLALMPDERPLQLEVKHKHPFVANDRRLYFGINNGQLTIIDELSRSGIDTLHMIMVKPFWTHEKSTGYLTQDPTLRKNVLFLACYLNKDRIRRLRSAVSSTSPERTSFSGYTRLTFKLSL